MKRVKNIFFISLFCIFFASCASPRFLLRRNQEELNLKDGEGGVLFSLYVHGQRNFSPQQVVVREINQYKPYRQHRVDMIPLPGYGGVHGDVYLFNMAIPRGTYQLSHFEGMVGGLFGSQAGLSSNKVFDVYPGEVLYIGRINKRLYLVGRELNIETNIEDYYQEDIAGFKSYYPVLDKKAIKKELMY